MILCISLMLVVTYYFLISNFIDCAPSPFAWWIWVKVYQFLSFKKKNSFLFFIDCSYRFLRVFIIYFCSGLTISFLLPTLGFLCSSFSTCFRCNVNLFVGFLVSWGKFVLLWTCLLKLPLPCHIGFGSLYFHFHLSLGIFLLLSLLHDLLVV